MREQKSVEQKRRDAEALLPQWNYDRVLNIDQNGRRICLLGRIYTSPSVLILERGALPSDRAEITALHKSLASVRNLGANDVYHWYLASSTSPTDGVPPDLKVNLIWPCNEKHVRKYSKQDLRMVTETPDIYRQHVRPFMEDNRAKGRLDWVWNILEGRTEQEDVILRGHGLDSSLDMGGDGDEDGDGDGNEGFLMLPDLNWDRKTISGLHLLAIVERRDIWSLRDLKKKHIRWLKHMRSKLLEATVKLYPQLEEDQLKLYVHYQPTYYHFHIHIVNVMLEAGNTQATGKAFGLENLISQLETMAGGDEAGMADVSLTYFIGEASDLWSEVFLPIKKTGMSIIV